MRSLSGAVSRDSIASYRRQISSRGSSVIPLSDHEQWPLLAGSLADEAPQQLEVQGLGQEASAGISCLVDRSLVGVGADDDGDDVVAGGAELLDEGDAVDAGKAVVGHQHIGLAGQRFCEAFF